MKSQLYLSFWRSNLIACARIAPDAWQIAILPQFLAIEPHFGLRREPGNRNFTSVFSDRTSFRAKGLQREPGNGNFTAVFGDRTSFRAKKVRRHFCKSQLYLSFWRSKIISCERVAPDALQIATLRQFLAIEPHFVRKGCDGNPEIADRTSFRTKQLRFVPSRWHCPAPSREK